MQIRQLVPTLITAKLAETRDFYRRWFGFEAVFDADWYVHLQHRQSGQEIGILIPGHDSQPAMFQAGFNGKGVGISFEVEDVDRTFDDLAALGAPLLSSVRDEPWGGRQFLMRDPAGVGLSVYQMVRDPHEASIEAALLTSPV